MKPEKVEEPSSWLEDINQSIQRVDSLIKIYEELRNASPDVYSVGASDETDVQVISRRLLVVKKEILEECLELKALLKKFSEKSVL